MKRRRNQDQGERGRDAWSRAWGDRALQDLGRRLTAYGVPAEPAAQAVEQVWLFYSYVALPILPDHVPFGLATTVDGRPEACCYLPHRSIDRPYREDPGAKAESERLYETFEHQVAAPLAADVVLNLKLVSAVPTKVARLAPRLRDYCRFWGTDYVGVFVDDLEAELKTVMAPRDVPRWLRTPNTIFAGRKPIEFLRDPRDRRLRDLITRAKFNLPAA